MFCLYSKYILNILFCVCNVILKCCIMFIYFWFVYKWNFSVDGNFFLLWFSVLVFRVGVEFLWICGCLWLIMVGNYLMFVCDCELFSYDKI